MNIRGVEIFSTPFAREVRDEFRVERHPRPKRRRRWRVVRHHIDRPGCYVGIHPLTGRQCIWMHPELLEKFKKEMSHV